QIASSRAGRGRAGTRRLWERRNPETRVARGGSIIPAIGFQFAAQEGHVLAVARKNSFLSFAQSRAVFSLGEATRGLVPGKTFLPDKGRRAACAENPPWRLVPSKPHSRG